MHTKTKQGHTECVATGTGICTLYVQCTLSCIELVFVNNIILWDVDSLEAWPDKESFTANIPCVCTGIDTRIHKEHHVNFLHVASHQFLS